MMTGSLKKATRTLHNIATCAAAYLVMLLGSLSFQPQEARASLPAQWPELVAHESALEISLADAQTTTDAKDSSPLSIWVGEVTLDGEKQIWVELIDAYGEVIYASAVRQNETHLLPDGRAIIARPFISSSTVAKTETSRVPVESDFRITHRQMIDDGTGHSIELLEPIEPVQRSPLLQMTMISDVIFAILASMFDDARDQLRLTWNWFFDTAHA